MIATLITTLCRDSHYKFAAECEARHELPHHVAIMALSIRYAMKQIRQIDLRDPI